MYCVRTSSKDLPKQAKKTTLRLDGIRFLLGIRINRFITAKIVSDDEWNPYTQKSLNAQKTTIDTERLLCYNSLEDKQKEYKYEKNHCVFCFDGYAVVACYPRFVRKSNDRLQA